MNDRFYRFNFFLLFFLSLLLLLFRLDTHVENIRIIFSYIFNPHYLSSQYENFSGVKKRLNNILKCALENEKLLNENLKLREKLIFLDTVVEENKKLKKILNIKAQEFKSTYAKIISFNPKNPYEFVFINKGSDDDVGVNNVVLYPEGNRWFLLGRVVEVYDNYSKVMLITNNNLMFTAETYKSSGLISGNNSNRLFYKYINGEFKIGDLVYTSFKSYTFPPKLNIGYVIDKGTVKQEGIEEYNYAVISTFDINELDYLIVIDYKPPVRRIDL